MILEEGSDEESGLDTSVAESIEPEPSKGKHKLEEEESGSPKKKKKKKNKGKKLGKIFTDFFVFLNQVANF